MGNIHSYSFLAVFKFQWIEIVEILVHHTFHKILILAEKGKEQILCPEKVKMNSLSKIESPQTQKVFAICQYIIIIYLAELGAILATSRVCKS